MRFLQVYIFALGILFLLSCSKDTGYAMSEEKRISNIIKAEYIDNNASLKNVDAYTYILDKKKREVFHQKIYGYDKSISSLSLKNSILYVKIHFFDSNVIKTIKNLLREDAHMKGLILDLRDNSGGLLSASITLVDMFIDKGVIIHKKSRIKEENRSYYAHQYNSNLSLPLVILINKRSASASEIVSGALQAHQRAILIGEKSFGKSSIQKVIELKNNRLLKFTIARYILANQKEMNTGVIPDLSFEKERLVIKSKEAHIKKRYKAISRSFLYHSKVDNDLLLAVEILSK